jgi:hypothetical protein
MFNHEHKEVDLVFVGISLIYFLRIYVLLESRPMISHLVDIPQFERRSLARSVNVKDFIGIKQSNLLFNPDNGRHVFFYCTVLLLVIKTPRNLY